MNSRFYNLLEVSFRDKLKELLSLKSDAFGVPLLIGNSLMDEMGDGTFGVAGTDYRRYPFAVEVEDRHELFGRPFEVLAQCQHGVKCVAEVFCLIVSICSHIDPENLPALGMTIDFGAQKLRRLPHFLEVARSHGYDLVIGKFRPIGSCRLNQP